MKKTAVEWFNNEILIHLNFDQRLYLKKAFEQAKEIEKQQQGYSEEDIAIAFDEGQSYSVTGKLIHGKDWIKTHKQEWFEQFKNK